MRVLIIGAAGRVGSALACNLATRHDLILGDITPLDDPRYLRLDVLDLPTLRSTVARADAVVSLAITNTFTPDYGSPESSAECMRVQVEGVYNTLRAARDAGAKRVIYASSVTAVAGYPPEHMVTSDDLPRTGGLYGVTKGFGEDLCRMAHAEWRLPVAILRLGNVYVPSLQGHPQQRTIHPSRVHVEDVADAFARALETPEPPYAVVHIVGEHPHRCWDLQAARDLYGWQPTVRFGPDAQPIPEAAP